MQSYGGRPLFSAGDLVGFQECEHFTTLSLTDLSTPLPRAKDDESLALIQDKGFSHESDYLASLKKQGKRVVEIPDERNPEMLAAHTLAAMREGHDIIFQAGFLSSPFFGKADFLRRVERRSSLGAWSYEAVDTKLARTPKAKFVLQLGLYSNLLGNVQGVDPAAMHLVLGDGAEHSFRVADYSRYLGQVKDRFVAFASAHANGTYPQRNAHCPFCPWRDICDKRWIDDDHLNQVAGIRQTQVERLHAAGVRTLEALAKLNGKPVAGMQPETLKKIRSQAALQLAYRESKKPAVELLPPDPEGRRGFHRLPPPDAGDVFFDMEGDPFEQDGLEYLFGVRYTEGSEQKYRAFWAHNRAQEKQAFESLMDFLKERLARHPGMHVYHYAHYEPTALKRLMSVHGTREVEMDDLLRRRVLVDLYKVVTEAMRTSQPGYSLKDLEIFYMEAREGEVKDAGASVVRYHRWRETHDEKELEEIRRYNDDDCRSTALLRDWLLSQRPAELPWYSGPVSDTGAPAVKSPKVIENERVLEEYRAKLLPSGDEVHELVFQLLDFHRRSAKPAYWAMFERQDMTEQQLIDDYESLGGLRLDASVKPVPEKRSHVYTFNYPEQETKLRAGKKVVNAQTGKGLGEIHAIDLERRVVQLKSTRELPGELSIGPDWPLDTDVIRNALRRLADSYVGSDDRFRAVRALLRKDAPRLRGHEPGTPIASPDAVAALAESYLFIQGPPGAGKTFTGSHVIADLLKQGKRIGVMSNSHRAINNLLAEVEKRNIRFSGVKKASAQDPESVFAGRFIESTTDAGDAIAAEAQLLAGTAWFFSEPALAGTLDYLFIDEAGQVSLAHAAAAGTSARNIVLIGDQMQLGQPIQGVHPGRSGESTLEYLLDDLATIPADRGIFLARSWRMHERVCRFISDAVYDGRLEPREENQKQALLLAKDAHPSLRSAGISFVPASHAACSQSSKEEAELVKVIYASLLKQRFVDKKGKEHAITPENILVVAPYNAQVNLLKSALPGARVGTIDKFQGQEAEAVIVSMTTSSGDYLPRNIEFLYDKHRLNVAISRAKCLAVVIASPDLLHVRCTTPAQMELVNTLCWVKEYAD
jgi:predicted RecB family nuclease